MSIDDIIQSKFNEIKTIYKSHIDSLIKEIEKLKEERDYYKRLCSINDNDDKLNQIIQNDETKNVLLKDYNVKRENYDDDDDIEIIDYSPPKKRKTENDEMNQNNIESSNSEKINNENTRIRKFVDVERRKEERKLMNGYSCSCCKKFYEAMGVNDPNFVDEFSRHRCHHKKPDTPPHFWNIDYISENESNNVN